MDKIPVCVLSFHPLVFPTIRAALPLPDFDLNDERVCPEDRARERGAPLPTASVYVIEAHARATLTEAQISRVTSVQPSPPVLVIGESFDDASAFSFLRMGTKGLLTFDQAPNQLSRAVRALVDGGFWVSRLLLARFVAAVATALPGSRRTEPGDVGSLTPRERQVLDGLIDNLSSKEIATRLRISERGVKFHISNLLAKNRVRRRADLVLIFLNSSTSSEDSRSTGDEAPPLDAAAPPASRS